MKKNKNTNDADINVRRIALDLVAQYEPAKMTTEKRLELAETYFDYLKNGDTPEAEEK